MTRGAAGTACVNARGFALERAEYEKLDQAEERMWWFGALHANLLACRQKAGGPSGRVLDAGCGTGGFLAKLTAADRETDVSGLDADEFACACARIKSGAQVCVGSVNALPFADAAFAAIFSADVLCHDGVDEAEALVEFHRCLMSGGVLVLNLPAYGWMLSRHDLAVYNVRRYTCGGIAALLRASGFRVCSTTYWNTLLFPIMVVTRKLLPGGDGSSDVKLYPAPVEALCRGATRLERLFLACGLRLPFGGSLIAVARKE
jgi:SAM-dependent methyltransferase